MLYYALVFLVIALIAGVLGFGGIAGAASGIAQILFFLFLAFLVISLIVGLSGGHDRPIGLPARRGGSRINIRPAARPLSVAGPLHSEKKRPAKAGRHQVGLWPQFMRSHSSTSRSTSSWALP